MSALARRRRSVLGTRRPLATRRALGGPRTLGTRTSRRVFGVRARPLFFVALVGVVVVLVLVGGLLKVGSESTQYWRAVDRSYAAQVRPVVAQSNQVGEELGVLVAELPRLTSAQQMTRDRLEATLDTLVRSGDSTAQSATTAASPAPANGAGSGITQAFADRSAALNDLRSTVDGLLEMTPLPVVGSADAASQVAPRQAPLPAPSAVSGLERVGALLQAADQSYAAGRRALRAAPGAASLPPSSWVPRSSTWSPASAQAMVTSLTSAPQLAVVHQVALLANDVGLTPAAVPDPQGGSAGSSMVPPTRQLSITAVVADEGTVAQSALSVQAVAQPSAGGSASRAQVSVSVTPGDSAAVTLPALDVIPGQSYTVTLSVTPPAGEVAGTTTTVTFPVAVAPPSPPSVVSLTPASGPKAGGTTVIVLGTGFTAVSAVTFGHTPAHFVVRSASEIIATAPPGTGAVTVTVTNPGGTSATTIDDRYTYKVVKATGG